MIAFAKRNLKLFFRDKSSVFFSLLSVLIVLGLYVLFLGDQLVSSMKDVTGANRVLLVPSSATKARKSTRISVPLPLKTVP